VGLDRPQEGDPTPVPAGMTNQPGKPREPSHGLRPPARPHRNIAAVVRIQDDLAETVGDRGIDSDCTARTRYRGIADGPASTMQVVEGQVVSPASLGRGRGEAPPGFEPGNNGFAIRCLTTWLRRPRGHYPSGIAPPRQGGRHPGATGAGNRGPNGAGVPVEGHGGAIPREADCERRPRAAIIQRHRRVIFIG
jgi:hypothetical protein